MDGDKEGEATKLSSLSLPGFVYDLLMRGVRTGTQGCWRSLRKGVSQKAFCETDDRRSLKGTN